MTVVDTSPPDIVRAAYVDLVVTDLDRARAFWVDLLGFHVTARASPTRCTSAATRSSSTTAWCSASVRRPACARIGFRVRTPDDVDRAERWFAERGCADPAGAGRRDAGTRPGGAGRRSARLHGRAGARDGQGRAARPALRPAPRRRASTASTTSTSPSPTCRWPSSTTRALGFGLSETIEDLSDGTLYAAWMFRKQTVHDIAFTLGAGPMLHHVAFAVPESHHILSLCDRIGALGLRPPHRARARPPRRVERLLPLPPRRRRPPRRGVHDRLLHR